MHATRAPAWASFSQRACPTARCSPDDGNPDGKHSWPSSLHSFEQRITRVLSIRALLVHSDNFMVNDRQKVKNWLHDVRAEVEEQYQVTDPFAKLEAADDVDICLFGQMIKDGPPELGPADPEQELKIYEYAFWWIRVVNAHFALTDMCGITRNDLTDKDKEFLEKTNNAFYDPRLRPVFEQVKRDVRNGAWQPLEPVARFEKGDDPGVPV